MEKALDSHETKLFIKKKKKLLKFHSIIVNFYDRTCVHRPPVYEPEKYAE